MYVKVHEIIHKKCMFLKYREIIADGKPNKS